MSTLPRGCWKSVGKCTSAKSLGVTAPRVPTALAKCGHCSWSHCSKISALRYEVQDALENQKAWGWPGVGVVDGCGISQSLDGYASGALCKGGRAVSEKRGTASSEGLTNARLCWAIATPWQSSNTKTHTAHLQDLHLQNQLVKFNKFLQDNEASPVLGSPTWPRVRHMSPSPRMKALHYPS